MNDLVEQLHFEMKQLIEDEAYNTMTLAALVGVLEIVKQEYIISIRDRNDE